MKKVKILTSPTCSYCHAAKDLLKQQGLSYQEIDATSSNIAVQKEVLNLLDKTAARTVPQIFIDDKPIGGFRELSELIQSSEFDLANTQFAA